MFQPWRLKLRIADEAFRAGRLEEAGQLLRESDLCEYLPAKRLLAKVAHRMVERAGQRVNGGQSLAGWRDLESARSMGATPEAVSSLRQKFIARRMAEAETYLGAGEPAAAVSRLDELVRHGGAGREVRALKEAASKFLAAQKLCRRGQFAEAEENLAAAAALAPNVESLDNAFKACSVKAAESRRLTQRLHEALSAGDWTRALAEAEALLELCPEHEAAQDARRRAWAAVGMARGDERRLPRPVVLARHKVDVMNGNNHLHPAERSGDQPADKSPVGTQHADRLSAGSRFLLWVDGVGGYLVCEDDQVILGQPVPGSQVDVPILGDISRRHARIRRDGEGYVLDPLRPVRLDGRPVSAAALLADGNVIELGHNVRVRFRRPHPLSATARLEFVSHHRTQPSADAVLLMAESCVLGPAGHSHIECPDWSHELVIFRQGGELFCRGPSRFCIDGAAVADRGRLTRSSQVTGEDFSLSIERI